MLELGFYENIVKHKRAALHFVLKILITAICVIATLATLVILSTNSYPPILTLIVLAVAAVIVYLSFIFLSVEHECSVSESSISLSRIYAKKMRRELFSADADDVLMIAPATEDNLKKAETYRPKSCFKVYDKASEDTLWLVVFEMKKGENALFIFTAPVGIEKIFRKIKPSALLFR